MRVDELRRGLTETAEAVRVDRMAGRRAVRQRVRRSRVGRVGLLIGGVAVLAIAVVVTWPTSSRNVAITSPPNNLPLDGLPGNPSAVVFSNGQDGYGLTTNCVVAARRDPVCAIGVLRTVDAGATWRLTGALRHITYVGWTGYPFISLAARGANVWIFGTRTFESHNGGRTIHLSQLKGEVMSLAPGPRDVWAATRSCPPVQACDAKLMSASVDGPNWQPLPTPPLFIDPYPTILRPTADVGYLSGEDTPFPIYRTDDGGQTWHHLFLPHSLGPVSLAAVGPRELWDAAGGPEMPQPRLPGQPEITGQTKTLFRSVDGGSHWTEVATGGSAASELSFNGLLTPTSLGVASSQRLWFASDFGAFVRSTDGGRTWFDTGLTDLGFNAGFDFVDATHGWVVSGKNGALYRMTDGTTWTRVSP